jgi:hypothetical protein
MPDCDFLSNNELNANIIDQSEKCLIIEQGFWGFGNDFFSFIEENYFTPSTEKNRLFTLIFTAPNSEHNPLFMIPYTPQNLERIEKTAIILNYRLMKTKLKNYFLLMPPRNIESISTLSKTQCVMCGEDNPHILEEHHIIPRSKNGSNNPENLITLCANCHKKIHRGEKGNSISTSKEASNGC